ncbi:hypothetical protein [Actinoplanes derwentensis]|uniref:hypothetical protein n=1 Tax=Actinoplanes derwentensis TaxID=113562 RepID=UPI0012FDBC4A|nr:hypothetical protein [Actinoplanes derwentensis]GID88366.1 hypothetical protein Ade03nite_72900 [Actinoplanes derwentensis]
MASPTPLFSWDPRVIATPTAQVELRLRDAAGNTAPALSLESAPKNKAKLINRED